MVRFALKVIQILDLSVSLFFVVVGLLFSWNFFSPTVLYSFSALAFLLSVWNYLLYTVKTSD